MSREENKIYTGVNTRVFYKTPGGRAFTSLEELDKEYDIDASVEDFIPITTKFVEDSAKAREELECTLDIPYGPTIAEKLDVFHGEPGGPVIIFIHGGYWKALTSKIFSFIAPGLVARGATVVIPTHALCPSVSMDEIVRQHRAVVAWTYKSIASYGGDPNRIIMSGHSAGGHGAVMTMLTDWENDYDLPADVIKAGCAISGLFDLRPLPFTFVQQELQLNGEEVLRNSPILNIPETAPPLLVTRGSEQTSEFLRQTDDFYEVWKAAGLEVELLAQAGVNHFSELLPLAEADSELTNKIMELANR